MVVGDVASGQFPRLLSVRHHSAHADQVVHGERVRTLHSVLTLSLDALQRLVRLRTLLERWEGEQLVLVGGSDAVVVGAQRARRARLALEGEKCSEHGGGGWQQPYPREHSHHEPRVRRVAG